MVHWYNVKLQQLSQSAASIVGKTLEKKVGWNSKGHRQLRVTDGMYRDSEPKRINCSVPMEAYQVNGYICAPGTSEVDINLLRPMPAAMTGNPHYNPRMCSSALIALHLILARCSKKDRCS